MLVTRRMPIYTQVFPDMIYFPRAGATVAEMIARIMNIANRASLISPSPIDISAAARIRLNLAV